MSLTSDQFVGLILDAVLQGLPTPAFEPLPVLSPVSTSSSCSPKPSGSCNGKVKPQGKGRSKHFKSLSSQSKRQSNLIKNLSNQSKRQSNLIKNLSTQSKLQSNLIKSQPTYPDLPFTHSTTDSSSLVLPPLADSIPDLAAYLASIEDPTH